MKAIVPQSHYWTSYLQDFLSVGDIFKNVSVRVGYESLSYASAHEGVRGVRKDGEMGPSPARNDGASRSLVPETCSAETLSSGFQVLSCRSGQEGEGTELQQASGGRKWGPMAGRGSQALPAGCLTHTHSCQACYITCSSEDGG